MGHTVVSGQSFYSKKIRYPLCHKGTPKFGNLKARIDNKGIEIFRGQTDTSRSGVSESDLQTYTIESEPNQTEDESFQNAMEPGEIYFDHPNVPVSSPSPEQTLPMMPPLQLSMSSRQNWSQDFVDL